MNTRHSTALGNFGRRASRPIVAALLAAAVLATRPAGLRADDSTHADLSNVAEQQRDVKNQSAAAGQQLDTIIADFEANGMGKGQDVVMLRTIRKTLNTLSSKQMDEVLNLLQAASSAKDSDGMHKSLTGAYTGQKSILAQLNDLVLRYEKEQELDDISLRFGQLAQRQNVNLRAAVHLVRALGSVSKRVSSFDEDQKSQLQIQQTEEASIRDEAASLVQHLIAVVGASEPDVKTRLEAVLSDADVTSLDKVLATASDEINKGNLYASASQQQAARATLRDLARLIAPPKDAADAIRAAIEHIDQTTAAQQNVETSFNAFPIAQMADHWQDLDDLQSDVVDATNELRKDLVTVAVPVAASLQTTQSAMNDLRPIIKAADKTQLTSGVKTVLDQLKAERAALADQLAQMDQKPDDTGNKLADSQALKDEIVALRSNEQRIKIDLDAAPTHASALNVRQKPLTVQARQLSLKASTDYPEIAALISGAATDMTSAESALAINGPVADADKPVQAAIDKLMKAETNIDNEVAQMEKDQKQRDALAEARDKIAKAIEQENKIDRQAAEQEQKPDPAAAKALAAAQQKNKDATDDVAKDLKAQNSPAADSTADASKKMDDAKTNLDNAKAPDAHADTTAAVADLNKSKKQLDDQIAQLDNKLGNQPDPTNALADAAKALKDAQQQVGQTMDQTPPTTQPAMSPQDMQKMVDAEKQIASELQQQAQTAPNAQQQQALNQAQQSATNAANQLQQNDPSGAQQSMQQVQQQIADAAGQPQTPPAGGQPQTPPATPAGGQPQTPPPAGGAGQPPTPPPGAGQSLAQTGDQQAALQQQLKAMMGGSPNPTAAAQLGSSADSVAKAAAEDGGQLPQDAASAMQQAAAALNAAAAAQHAGNQPGAQQAAGQAQSAMAAAQQAIAMAQAGMQPGQSQSGQAMANSNTPGKPTAGPPGPSKSQGMGKRQSSDGSGNGDSQLNDVRGTSAFVGLPPRDRNAIQQSRAEKYPQDYGSMVEQYYRNLSDEGQH